MPAHEPGLNPYLFEMANIREQDSWVTTDKVEATKKAKALIAAAVGRVAHQQPLNSLFVPIDPTVLVVGGGITGIQAALEIADSGQSCLSGRTRTIHWRAYGSVRQDLPDPGLLGLHPDPQDVRCRQSQKYHLADLERGREGGRLHR